MKSDLATAIVAAVLGLVVAFFVTNLFIPAIEPVSFKNLSSTVDNNLADPDENVFNYKALNPTVEVYVGECQNFDENGECLDDVVENNNQNDNSDVEEDTEEEAEENTDTDEETNSAEGEEEAE